MQRRSSRDYVVRNVIGHACNIPHRSGENVLSTYVQGGGRKFLANFVLASPKVRECREMFFSTGRIEQEQIRQISHYPYMIHPFSRLIKMWQSVMVFVYLVQLILAPVEIAALNQHLSIEEYITKAVFDIFCWIDIFINFSTGFVAQHVSARFKIELRRRTVFWNYLWTYFFIDALPSIPFGLILFLTDELDDQWRFKMFLLLRMGRMPTFYRLASKMAQRMGISRDISRIVLIVVVIVITIFWGAALYTLMKAYYNRGNIMHAANEKESITNTAADGGGSQHVTEQMVIARILENFYYVSSLMFWSGTDAAQRILEFFFQIFLIILGFVLQFILLVEILDIIAQHTITFQNYNYYNQQIDEFSAYKELPPELRVKIAHYIIFRFQKHFYVEQDVMRTLTPNLRYEILVYLTQRLSENLSFFRYLNLAPEIMLEVVTKMTMNIYMPGDVVLQGGLENESIYFVHVGLLARYSSDYIELGHLKEGDNFGEECLVAPPPPLKSSQDGAVGGGARASTTSESMRRLLDARNETIIAIAECELYQLRQQDFDEVMTQYPAVYADALRMINSKIEESGGGAARRRKRRSVKSIAGLTDV